jgi:hypothetical protein
LIAGEILEVQSLRVANNFKTNITAFASSMNWFGRTELNRVTRAVWSQTVFQKFRKNFEKKGGNLSTGNSKGRINEGVIRGAGHSQAHDPPLRQTGFTVPD